MYGITFDLDAHILEDVCGIGRKPALDALGEALAKLGYVRVQYGVYVCTEPTVNGLLVVHETIEALRSLDWFCEAVTRVEAFELRSWGSILEPIKDRQS